MPQQFTEGYLRQRSKQLLDGKVSEFTVFNEEEEARVPRFEQSEIEVGRILGRGGFCTVSSLQNVTLISDPSQATESKSNTPYRNENDFFIISQDRNYIADNFVRESDGKHRYAVKKLTPGLFAAGDPHHFVSGVIDLAMEVRFLSILRHPHIIKMRAMANCDHCSKDFFILLDRLNETLTKRVEVWKKEKPTGFGKKEEKEQFFVDRLVVGYDICSALSHLHERNIVYRDLKPDNIGFDVRDDVKIFDFGLATEMVDSRKVAGTDTYLFTKDTGSPRYMAPEVYNGVPYNEKCDVYSFGLILWQILELNPPFEKYDIKKMIKDVYKGKVAPKLSSSLSQRMKDLFTNCSARSFGKRHSCNKILSILKGELGEYEVDAMGELDVSNRTEASLKESIRSLRL